MTALENKVLGDEKPLTPMTELALQQFIGFRHAVMGFSIESLAQEMGLTTEEWEVIRDDCVFTESDLEALDKYFYGEDE